MKTRIEIELWSAAAKLFLVENQPIAAIETFSLIHPSCAKVLFNIGLIYTFLEEHEKADTFYEGSLQIDQYFAAAYFQKGLSLFQLAEYDLALRCYRFSLELLLENDFIDYTSLGLSFKLYRCEVLYNLAICHWEFGDCKKANIFLQKAFSFKRTAKHHGIISTSFPAHVTPFSIPSTILFLVADQKVRNLERKDFLKSAKLVVDTKMNLSMEKLSRLDDFIGFTGAAISKPNQISPGSTLARQKVGHLPSPLSEIGFNSDSINPSLSRSKANSRKSTSQSGHRRNVSEPNFHQPIAKSPTLTLPRSADTLKEYPVQNHYDGIVKSKIFPRKSSLSHTRRQTPFNFTDDISLLDKEVYNSEYKEMLIEMECLELASDSDPLDLLELYS